jgi:hypothetical protein
VGGGERTFACIAEVGAGWFALPFHDLGPMMKKLRAKAAREVPVTVLDVNHDPGGLTECAEVGAERVLLELPTLPDADSLRELDRTHQRNRCEPCGITPQSRYMLARSQRRRPARLPVRWRALRE